MSNLKIESGNIISMLTLSDAIKSGRLQAFIAEQESAGIGPIDRAEFDGAVGRIIKAPRPKDRTSHSASDGNSTGKKIQPDTDQGAAG
jgi:hypothetical protein